MILFFLIAVFSFFLQLFLPWWSMTIVAFAISFLLGKKLWPVFFSSFFACGIVWLLMAVYIHFTNGDIMTNRIAQLLSLSSSVMLYVGAFLTSGIVGGIAGLAGFFLKEILKTKNEAIRI